MKIEMQFKRQAQNGAVLILALLMLLVLTILGVSSMKTTLMAEYMAGNLRDQNIAFQAAESGLRDASAWISSQASQPQADSSASFNIYAAATYVLGDIASSTYDWDKNAIAYGKLSGTTKQIGSCDPSPSSPPTALPNVHALPCFVIEEHAFVPDDLDPDTSAKGLGRYYYRITSLGHGSTDTAKSIIQAIVFERFN